MCDKKTSDAFLKVYGYSFEEYVNSKKQEKKEIIIEDYDWLNEEKEDDIY